MGQLQRALICVCGAFGLLACEPAATPHEAPASALLMLDYDFAVASVGRTGGAGPSSLASTARGQLSLAPLDDPPLWVGSLGIDHMQLHAGPRTLSRLEPGRWAFLARRTREGALDALWFAEDMPPAARSMARFVLAELQTSSVEGEEEVKEQTTGGPAWAHYRTLVEFVLELRWRSRHSPAESTREIWGTAALLGDRRGPQILASAQRISSALDGHEALGSLSILFVERRRTRLASASLESQLRAQIERLSASAPVPVPEQALTEAAKDVMRRQAESWGSVRGRLLVGGEGPDPQLLGRAAAHMRVDADHRHELARLAAQPTTTQAARVRIYAAIGECGSSACQELLCTQLEQAGTDPRDVLAALTRVHRPSAITVDRLFTQARGGGEVTRAALGVVLARFAETDANGAAKRVHELLAPIEGCGADLEAWMGMLGNAGLSVAGPGLIACMSNKALPLPRRRKAVRALRRLTSEEVTSALLSCAAQDTSTLLRETCLGSLRSHELRDRQLAPLVAAGMQGREASELGAVRELLESIGAQGELAASLLAQINEEEAPEPERP